MYMLIQLKKPNISNDKILYLAIYIYIKNYILYTYYGLKLQFKSVHGSCHCTLIWP